jgi:Gamma-glutamyl cyclotransferase, AIG2-like
MRFFFYGTLLDDALRRVVIGRDVALGEATLPGWQRRGVVGKHYPMIERDAAASVAGGVTENLAPGEIARLRHYEGDGYELITAAIRDRSGAGIAAAVFVPEAGSLVAAGDWSLGDWQHEHRGGVLGRLATYRWPKG